MAEAAKSGGLSKIFNLHNLHYAMLAGMAVAACAAFTASTGLPITVPNVVAATADAAFSMIGGLAQLPQFISNLTFTDWGLTYQFGAAHAAHGTATTLATAAGEHALHETAAGVASCTASFPSWQAGLGADGLAQMQSSAEYHGQSLQDYYQNTFCTS